MITATIYANCGSTQFKCDAVFLEEDPFAVTLTFQQANDTTNKEEWRISRELLAEGLDSELWIGMGDVRVRRDSHNTVQLHLENHEEDNLYITLSLPRRPLKEFLTRTHAKVAAGTESDLIDWDDFDEMRAEWI